VIGRRRELRCLVLHERQAGHCGQLAVSQKRAHPTNESGKRAQKPHPDTAPLLSRLPHLAIFNDRVGWWLAWEGSLVRSAVVDPWIFRPGR
jgi:hypothetical protein